MSQPASHPHLSQGLFRFAEDVRHGLASTPRQLNPAYFYDALGSCLFDAICLLPSYPITRTETGLLAEHAGQIVAGLPDPACLIELGCGNGEKISRLVEALDHAGRHVAVHLVDISAAALEETARQLERWPEVSVTTHQEMFEPGLQQAVAQCGQRGAVMVLFLGSNIGNFDAPGAGRFLATVRDCLRHGDRLLLGVDLVKAEAELLLAYDDPLGVTAAFNKNLLQRINRELGGNFDLRGFDHQVHWNAAAARIEMHLRANRQQRVSIPAAGCTVDFAPGEGIWTESSYKYRPEQIAILAGSQGFSCEFQLLDAGRSFALNYLVA
ncbi:MAG: L-histidine N(alpha)-methyltransferase [Bacteroidota bacterium]